MSFRIALHHHFKTEPLPTKRISNRSIIDTPDKESGYPKLTFYREPVLYVRFPGFEPATSVSRVYMRLLGTQHSILDDPRFCRPLQNAHDMRGKVTPYIKFALMPFV